MNATNAIFPVFTEHGPVAQLVDMGGPVMIVLIVIALIGVVTFIYLMLFGTFYAPRFTRPLKQLVEQWQRSPADTPVQQVQNKAGLLQRSNPLMHLLTNTMSACQSNPNTAAVRETAIRDAQSSLEPFEAPLKIIEVIAALAPLLGLLGTVMGMMEAFSAMAATEGRANASQLSGGIYEALTTTAAGLVVAIPFAALAAWIEFRLRRIHKTINSTLVSVFNVMPLPVSEPAAVTDSAERQSAGSSRATQDYAVDDNPRFAHATG